MKDTKKCPHCGQWSHWNQNPEDRCEHCRNPLDPITLNRQQAKYDLQQQEKQRFSLDLIRINPDDSWFIRFTKKVGLGFQLIFVAIITFFIWFIAFVAA
ncbi:RNHCP domain-containing protein (plasmid) [Adhaeribacter swui]|uniref:RNHCP domain-containing protein n=1 Tax=Adhaeribacter swui TaxID=2086471 RepID=A0A7G7G2E4_9BACT|nr:RNHCP domain-containing protein [Adhaeribacter swui]QNF31328.1 RNHCP domain-containing protein [Adhaeribacter swui]